MGGPLLHSHNYLSPFIACKQVLRFLAFKPEARPPVLCGHSTQIKVVRFIHSREVQSVSLPCLR